MDNVSIKAGAVFSRPFTVKLPTGNAWSAECKIVDEHRRTRAVAQCTLTERVDAPGTWDGTIVVGADQTVNFERPREVNGSVQFYYDIRFYVAGSPTLDTISTTYGLRVIWGATK